MAARANVRGAHSLRDPFRPPPFDHGQPPPYALRVGSSVLLAGLSGLILLTGMASTVLLLAALALIGIGHGLTFMAALRQATATAPATQQASVAATFFSITYLGGALPVIAVGLMATALTVTIAVELFAATAAALLLTLLLANPRPY